MYSRLALISQPTPRLNTRKYAHGLVAGEANKSAGAVAANCTYIVSWPYCLVRRYRASTVTVTVFAMQEKSNTTQKQDPCLEPEHCIRDHALQNEVAQ